MKQIKVDILRKCTWNEDGNIIHYFASLISKLGPYLSKKKEKKLS